MTSNKPKLRIRKGDQVVVLSGKDRGKQGQVIAVLPAEGKVIVEGVNVAKRHQKPTRATMQGGIIDKDLPMPISKVAVVSPEDGRATRVGYRYDDDGNKYRICKRTGADLP